MIDQKIKTSLTLVFCVVAISASVWGTFNLLGADSHVVQAQVPETLQLNLTTFATGLNNPVGITNAGPGDDRLFVIEQAGIIKIVQPDGTAVITPFLDITALVDSSRSESGLLGLAFHPDYASNGFFYLNYYTTTLVATRTHISRFAVSGDPNIADPNSEEILLTIDQPQPNHNAGDLHFGPDGYLYIPMGDGGGGGDPGDNAQDLGVLLGKVIRIDVDSGPGNTPDCQGAGTYTYTIPTTNPLTDVLGACDEIWASGLRNPWRSSFDRLTGDFYIGDVGQKAWEEISFQPANSTGGENYGWDCKEGSLLYSGPGTSSPDCGSVVTFTNPIFEYNHSDDNCTVIGGYVYRGSQYPVMDGRYLLTDYCTGIFWDLARDGETWHATTHINLTAFGYVAFGEDTNGELYVVNIDNHTIYRLGAISLNIDKLLFFPVIVKNS